MKKLMVAAIGLLCVAAMVVQAQDTKKPRKELTPEQQTVMKEMLAKYDTNQDGKIDKEERAKMSKEDKDKMAKAGLRKPKASHPAEASTNAPATDK